MFSTFRPFLRLLFIVSIATSSTVFAQSLFTCGDASCDGVVDVPDPHTISKVFFREKIQPWAGLYTVDANPDGASGPDDTAFLLRVLALDGSPPPAPFPCLGPPPESTLS